MKGIINNIITFYSVQAKALSILIANTQKALEQSEKERKANEQIQRVENFVKDLTMNLNSMLTRFYYLKERKNRKQEQMTDSQAKAVAEFAIFVKTLTKNVCSLLKRFQKSQTFEEKIDKKIRELEVEVGQKLGEFDKALDETTSTLTIRLIKLAQNIIGSFTNLLQVRNIVLAIINRRKLDKSLKKSIPNTKEDSQVVISHLYDSQLENLFDGLRISSANRNKDNSKYMTHLKV